MPRPYERAFLPSVVNDLQALAEIDPRLVDAALRAVTDLANGHKRGKALGDRHVSGDLSGCYRLQLDVAGQRPQRFRIIYRLRPPGPRATTLEIITIGPRGGHTAYRTAVKRLDNT